MRMTPIPKMAVLFKEQSARKTREDALKGEAEIYLRQLN
jgi:hypothetical protein